MTMQKKIAKITHTMLGEDDAPVFTASITVDYGGGGQSIGGYCLDTPRRDARGQFMGRVGTAYGMEWIARFVRACGVNSWEKLVGRTIFVLHDLPEGASTLGTAAVIGVENLPTERGERFIFADLLKEFGFDDE